MISSNKRKEAQVKEAASNPGLRPLPPPAEYHPDPCPPVIERLRARARRRRLAHHGALAAVLFVALLLWLPRFSGPIDLRYDAGVYYLLGTSLASGDGYRIPSEPGAPEGVQYPPLLPALVAVHQWVLGTGDPAVVAPWLRITYAGIFFAYAFSVFTLSRRLLGPGFAAIAATFTLLSLHTYFLSDLLFAEIPFALLSVCFVLVADGGPRGPRSWRREAALFALASAGFLLRTAGLALLAAWALEAFVQRRWRAGVLRGVLALIPFGLWQAHIARVERSQDYQNPAYAYQRAPYQYYNVSYGNNIRLVDPFRPELGETSAATVVKRVATNVIRMPLSLGETVTLRYGMWKRATRQFQTRLIGVQVIPEIVWWLPVVAFSVAVVAGLVILVRGEAWMIVLITGASIGLICLTPWPGQFPRYLSPLAPFLSIAALLAFARFKGSLAARGWTVPGLVGRLGLASLIALGIACQAMTARRVFQTREREGAMYQSAQQPHGPRFLYHENYWRTWEQAVAWIANNAPGDAIVATTSPHFCYLLTGRLSVLPPMEADPVRARELLEAVPVSYVIVDEMDFLDISRHYALPAVLSAPETWRLVHAIEGTRVYARIATSR